MKFLQPFVISRKRQAAMAFKADGVAHFILQTAEKRRRILRQFGHILAYPQLPDQTGGVPRGARGQALAFKQYNVLPAKIGQVIGEAAADRAATNNHHPSGRGNGGGHGRSPRRWLAVAFSRA